MRQRGVMLKGSAVRVAAATLFVALAAMLGCGARDDAGRFGVQGLEVRPTAGGHMLDFRFRVDDADKARPLFARDVRPVLVDEATGRRLHVPVPAKVGPLKSSGNVVDDRVYFVMFANPGRAVRSGDRVTITMGDFHARHLAVR